MIHAEAALARRLEGLICGEFLHLASVAREVLPRVPVRCIEVGGGVALWLGEKAPVNLAVGLGMTGPIGEAELERVEAFYHDRGADAMISMCPLAHGSLLEGLGRRCWRASGFEHLLVLELSESGYVGDAPPPEGVEVRVCRPDERSLWGKLAARGFSDGGPPERRHEEFGTLMAAREDAILVLAWVEGVPAGTGALAIAGGVGWLSGDSTLPQFRRRGVQQALQQHRLLLAQAAGCELAATEAVPGGASQRNMERIGFRIAYSHVEFLKDVKFVKSRG
jgi:GNAT superfamily N-acetyltransferase